MSIDDRVIKRFEELEQERKQMRFGQMSSGGRYVIGENWQKWATSVLSLLQRVFTEESVHFQNLQTIYKKFDGSEYSFNKASGVFLAAKTDYKGGYLFTVESAISGEIFGDFVTLAKQALKEGNKDVAAVFTCAALEDTLKKFAKQQGLDVDDKVMQQVVAALKSKGLVSGAQKSLLDTMPKIRDYAMHANWDKITPEDVSSVVGFVEQFLLRHFSA